jgi:tetratricopeptide (TPR) repeat protein
LKTGASEKGEEAYRKVVEIDPENLDIWYHLIQLNIEKGNDEQAMKDVYESLNFHFDDSRILLQWSELLMKSGETALSLYVFEDALEYDTEIVSEYISTFKHLSANPTIKNIINQFKAPQIN